MESVSKVRVSVRSNRLSCVTFYYDIENILFNFELDRENISNIK